MMQQISEELQKQTFYLSFSISIRFLLSSFPILIVCVFMGFEKEKKGLGNFLFVDNFLYSICDFLLPPCF
jgi:hypothetical protein